MKRPVDINSLLDNEYTGNAIQKPKFLAKRERLELSSKSHPIKSIIKQVSPKNVLREDSVPEKQHIVDMESNQEKKKRKFQFEWNEEDDTSINHISSMSLRFSSATKLLHHPKDYLENMYIGKHWSKKEINEMDDRDWRILKEDFNITIKGSNVANPLRNWDELSLIPQSLLDVILKKFGYETPTPIQRATIPNIINKRDFIGIATTGSGKTLSFLIPIFIRLYKFPSLDHLNIQDGPLALILAPTRELAQQIESEAKNIANNWKDRECNVVSIVGGHSYEHLSFSLRHGCDILVATPGVLIDCLETHIILLKQVQILVLDEADVMIDFGFEDQLKNILSNTESIPGRQTMMFTATMSLTIERMANSYLDNPVSVTIDGDDKVIPKIQQLIEYSYSPEQRFIKLKTNIIPFYKPPILIFINYKKTADWLFQKFQSETNFKVTILHGSKSQEQRERSLDSLRTGKSQIMIATNVAGRGIDIPNVSLVINFQMPTKLDDYIHRIGRTGRAGKNGTAITFLDEENDDIKLVNQLIKYVKANNPINTNMISPEVIKKFNIRNEEFDLIIH